MYTLQLDYRKLIQEDTPYFDLTAHLLGLDEQQVKITYFTRERCVACGTEEVREIFKILNIKTDAFIASGTLCEPGSVIISGTGRAVDVHMAWKPGQNMIDQASGIATKARRMTETVRAINKNITILTTRKIFPGTKAIAAKAAVAGGAVPHRLGTSESILVFPQQIRLMGGMDKFLKKLPLLKSECCEKKLIVETESEEEASMLLRAGADGIQFEKIDPDVLTGICKRLSEEFPSAVLLAAGGINENNAAAYAATGVSALVTSNVYNAKPIDISARLENV